MLCVFGVVSVVLGNRGYCGFELAYKCFGFSESVCAVGLFAVVLYSVCGSLRLYNRRSLVPVSGERDIVGDNCIKIEFVFTEVPCNKLPVAFLCRVSGLCNLLTVLYCCGFYSSAAV